jgi:hypothetical protein
MSKCRGVWPAFSIVLTIAVGAATPIYGEDNAYEAARKRLHQADDRFDRALPQRNANRAEYEASIREMEKARAEVCRLQPEPKVGMSQKDLALLWSLPNNRDKHRITDEGGTVEIWRYPHGIWCWSDHGPYAEAWFRDGKLIKFQD